MGGAVQYPKTYLKEAFELVRERGGLCIADEVFFLILMQPLLILLLSVKYCCDSSKRWCRLITIPFVGDLDPCKLIPSTFITCAAMPAALLHTHDNN